MTLLTNLSEERGLDHGYTFALVNLAWAPGQALGAAGGGAARSRNARRRPLPRAFGRLRVHASQRCGACAGTARVSACRRCSSPIAGRSRYASSVRRASSASARSPSSRADDLGSLHARSADDVVEIASYLDPAEHLRAAQQLGADAIHPGYGFLAENGDFAEAVAAAGLTWIGPPPEALRAGGDKLAAKQIAAERGSADDP